MKMDIALLIQILSMIGFGISLYFLFTYHGLAKPSNKLIPINICSKNTCHSILQTRFSKVFKIQNFYLGMVYYYIIFILSFFKLPEFILISVIVVAWLVVFFSLYLAYALIFKLKTACNLCFTAQIINLLIAILYTILVFK